MMSDDAAERQVSDAELGRDAQRYITVDAEILSGTPCLKGTRVPAHYIADMVANGDSASAILAAYPYLTEGQIHEYPNDAMFKSLQPTAEPVMCVLANSFDLESLSRSVVVPE